VQNGTGPLPQRIAAAEQNMRLEEVAEAKAEAYKIRIMMITMTVLGAVFGVAMMGPGKQ